MQKVKDNQQVLEESAGETRIKCYLHRGLHNLKILKIYTIVL